jgi:hypothetical protein
MIRSTPGQVIGLIVIYVVSFGVAFLFDSRPLGTVLIGLPLFAFASVCYIVGIQLASKKKPPKRGDRNGP